MRYFILLIFIAFINSIINAEDKKYVSDIMFKGNSNFSDDELGSIILLKSPKLFYRSEFNAKRLNRDKINLESFYKSNGFLEVKINGNIFSISEKYKQIIFLIEEGPQYQLKSIEIAGNKFFSDTQIINKLNVSIKKYYNPGYLRKQLKSLKREYLEQGKINIAIMDEVSIEANSVTVRINIAEGNTFYIRDIYTSGLEFVKEKYILRELLFTKQDLYNINKIDISRSRIFDSGLFSSVEITPKLIDHGIGLVDIEIKVREYKSASVEANLGFKEIFNTQDNITETGLDAQGRWKMGTIFNTSSNIEITGNLSSEINLNIFQGKSLIKKELSIIYFTPWTFYFRLPSLIKYYHAEESEDFILIRDGITYSIYLNTDEDTRWGVNSTLELIQTDDSLNPDDERTPARYINVKYLSNKIKHPLNPIGGKYFSIGSTLYGTILGGESHFYKLEGEYRKYIKTMTNSILAFRIIVGYIQNLDESNDINIRDNFHLGGQTNLRGWASPDEFELPDGGLITDIINIEYRFPISKKFGSELFFDAGRLYNNLIAFKTTDISWDYGIGLIYKTKLGPIRVDIGFPYGDLSKLQPHASLLYMF